MAPSPASKVLCSSWATLDDVPQRVLDKLLDDGITSAEFEPFLLRASEILWSLSGRTWYGSGCEEAAIIRSFSPPPGTGTWPYDSSWGRCGCWLYGTWLDGRWFPGPFPGQHQQAPVAIRLPRSPVTSIVSVTIDGDPFLAWNLMRSGWLERTDGRPWQACGDSTEVIYRFGEPPPQGGIDAAVELAAEMARDMFRVSSCRLPPNVVSITRQGVTMELMASDARSFRTGLYLVDLWLDTVNPYSRPQSAQVWSPDVPRLAQRSPTREV